MNRLQKNFAWHAALMIIILLLCLFFQLNYQQLTTIKQTPPTNLGPSYPPFHYIKGALPGPLTSPPDTTKIDSVKN
ncbi:MAG TPA: hypothetical protein PKZ16_02060 [bacterium]|nr:hypothetical protein [bacterium]HPL95618.1 hypothetical protein [bacterium]